MEEMNDKDQQQPTPLPGNSGKQKLQRYGLRSGNKSKEEKPPAPEMTNSASKRGRPLSSLSKSLGVLELSAMDKSAAKPPRRQSIPTKSNISPAPKFAGNITPISEARVRRAAASSKSPVSDVSRSTSNRKKFNVLSSASYWLSQIRLSETASKHSISIGFFKLALEAGCEPLQRMRDELKSYARRHNLGEQGEPMKELFESYNISENSEQLQVSEPISQVPEEGTRSSDDEVHSSSSTAGSRKLKPKSLITNAPQASPVTESAMKGNNNRRNSSAARIKGSWNKNSAVKIPAPETGGQKSIKKPQKPNKVESNKDKDKIKKQGKKSAGGKDPITPPEEEAQQSNKENMDVPQVEEMGTAD